MNKYVEYAFMGIGCGLIAYGIYLIYQPLFFISVGIECIVVALLPWKKEGGSDET